MANHSYPKQRDKVEPPLVGIAALRKSHNLTQPEVAAGIASRIDKPFSQASLSLIETGGRGASAEVLAALEDFFGIGAGSLHVGYVPSHDRRGARAA